MSLFVFLKDQLPIIDVVSQFVQIRPAGTYWKGSCPFHSEKDASFTVSPDKQIFYCFGCHATGDVIGFIAKLENLTQREAAQFLVDRFNINIPPKLAATLELTEDRDGKERYFKLCKAVAEWAHKQLLTNKAALTYVRQRNISDQSIKTFQVGYFPGGGNAINSLLRDVAVENFLLKDLLDCHIVMEGRISPFSPFEERIIFPIKNATGRNCGFGGRVFKPGDDRPKYYNSKETDGFEKGKLLFGFDLAKKKMQEASQAFLVEGYMDCVIMAQYGYLNTIATLGTACTSDHLKNLARLVHTLLVVYDGDQAGQKAMLRLTELCWEANLDVKVITLPEGHDPASFLSQNGDFTPLIEQALDIVTFFINTTGANFADKPLAHKLAAAEKMVNLIGHITNPFKQDLLLQHIATLTQLPFESLKGLMQQTNGKRAFWAEKASAAPLEEQNADFDDDREVVLLEEKIFSAILNGLTTESSFIVPQEIRAYFSPQLQEAIQRLETFKQSAGEEVSITAFFDTLDETLKQWAVPASMRHDGPSCGLMLKQLLARFCKSHWQRIARDFRVELAQAKQDNNDNKVQEVLKRFTVLKQNMLARGLMQ
jgi:DNA primase